MRFAAVLLPAVLLAPGPLEPAKLCVIPITCLPDPPNRPIDPARTHRTEEPTIDYTTIPTSYVDAVRAALDIAADADDDASRQRVIDAAADLVDAADTQRPTPPDPIGDPT